MSNIDMSDLMQRATDGLEADREALLRGGRERAAHHARRRRRLAGMGVTGLAAASIAAVVTGLGPSGVAGPTPAYAVEGQADGTIEVTIHRIEDAAGLEQALADRGLDATVDFDEDLRADREALVKVCDANGECEELEGVAEIWGTDATGHWDSLPGSGCQEEDAATLAPDGEDWILTIPADSLLHEQPFDLTTGPRGSLAVSYDSTVRLDEEELEQQGISFWGGAPEFYPCSVAYVN